MRKEIQNEPALRIRNLIACFFALALLFWPNMAQAYSVLTHQAIIDAAWKNSFVPALERQFPGATEAELIEAHAFAYGGAIMPDMGYYPLGSVFFTDLVHYVRTGDFTKNLLEEAKNRNELAFALGAVAHYYGDVHGHSIGTNPSVPLVYPKTKQEFGQVVTYGQDPVSHMRMEFGFDVLQAARGNYAPQEFRNFIGFKIATCALERAYFKTYGITLKSTFLSFPVAEFLFRLSVKAVLPLIIDIGWGLRASDLTEMEDTPANRKMARRLGRASFQKEFGDIEEKPGIPAYLLAFIMRFVPKLGMLKPLNFELPTKEAEVKFVQSFKSSLLNYEKYLAGYPGKSGALPDLNFDTGAHPVFSEYQLADMAYARLLSKLSKDEFETASGSLKLEAKQFFKNLPAAPASRKYKKQWRKTKKSLKILEKNFQETGPENET